MSEQDDIKERLFYTDEEVKEEYNKKLKIAELNRDTEGVFYFESLLKMYKSNPKTNFLTKDLFENN